MKKAMIFAAGLGTRLRPLTNDRPKALVELAGKTLLQRAVDTLCNAGIERIIINIHHFPDLMRQAIENLDYHNAEIIVSDETDLLLDTGGGLLKAARFLEGHDPVVLHNVDIVSGVDIAEMVRIHKDERALASLAVSYRDSSRFFLWDKNRLCGWKNTSTSEQIDCYIPELPPQPLAFSGIHIISPELLKMITETGVFSINKVYLRLAASNKIICFKHDPQFWADLGTLQKLQSAEKLVAAFPKKFNSF